MEIPDTGILPIRKCVIKKTTDGVETRVLITIPYRSMPSPSMRSQSCSICKHILLREYYNSFDTWCAIFFLFFIFFIYRDMLSFLLPPNIYIWNLHRCTYVTHRTKVWLEKNRIGRDKSVLAASIIPLFAFLWAHVTLYISKRLNIYHRVDKIKWNVNNIDMVC